MLVISPNLTLSPTENFAAGVPLILWRNIATATNIAADSAHADYPVTNLVNPSTLEEWRASAAGDVEITVTPLSADDMDGVGLARHNFGTAGISVEVGYYDETDTWESLAGPQVPPNDEPLMFRFTAQPVEVLTIRLASGSEAARAAVLYAGKLLVVERGYDVGPEVTPPRFARKTEVASGRSVRGDFLGRIVLSQWLEGAEFTFSHFRPDWYRTHFDPFVLAAQRDTPFFFAWSPENYPDEVAYCWLSEDPVPATNVVTGRKKITLKLDGIVE